MKKVLFVLLIIVCICALCSCDGQSITYIATEGGYIEGELHQENEFSPVRAVANDGYIFLGWSDGVAEATRTDVAPQGNIKIKANFAPKTYSVKYNSEHGGSVEGNLDQTISHGSSSKPVKAVADLGYKFLCWSNGEQTEEIVVSPKEDITLTAIFVEDALNLPIISIYTEDSKAISTKEEYVKCKVSVSNTDSEYILSDENGKIKLRGNTTSKLPKSPYKLKFDEKIDLFGNGKSKTWTLIANYMDCSLIRNYIAYSLGAEFDNLNFTTSFKNAEVYVNGKYDGVYLICEQVEAGTNRVDIDENYDSADTGYLIEMDSRAPQEGYENIDYFSIREGELVTNYAIKSPDPEEDGFSGAHVEFIKNYVQQCMTALDGNDFEDVCALMDVYSFADGYILDELLHCVDIGYSSFYMYKDKDGKLSRGPIWDYDLSIGNCSYQDNAVKPDYLWAKQANLWYTKLFKFDEFSEIVANRLSELEDVITTVIENCHKEVLNHKDSFNRNFERWKILGKKSTDYSPKNIYKIKTWEGHVDYVINWLSNSLENLKTCYQKN